MHKKLIFNSNYVCICINLLIYYVFVHLDRDKAKKRRKKIKKPHIYAKDTAFASLKV
jgi:hypothetical protein